MDPLKERLLQVIDKLGITKAQFEKNVGLSNGFVDKSGDNTRKSSLEKISNIYPEINTNWILTGEGKMFKTIHQTANGDGNMQVAGNGNTVTHTDTALTKALDEIAEQRKLVSKAQEQIDRLIGLLEKK